MRPSSVFVSTLVVCMAGAAMTVLAAPTAPAIKTIHLDAGGKDYLALLEGPPQTVTMRSGLVVLAPGKSVGEHSSKDNEETIVVLEGHGELRVPGRPAVPFEKEMAVYIPPGTDHDMVNTGTGVLRYVYVVASAKK